MSEVITDKLTGRATANDITVTVGASATMSLEQGLAKHYINFDASSGTPTSNDSFNVSSITDTTTGQFAINMTNNYANANYSLTGYTNTSPLDTFSADMSYGIGTDLITDTTSGVHEFLSYSSSTYRDAKHCDAQGFGDIA